MFLLFKRRKTKQFDTGSALGKLVIKINAVLKVWAIYLQKRTSRETVKTKVVKLVGFVIVAVALNIYLIAASLINTKNNALLVTRIVIPDNIIKRAQQESKVQKLLMQKDYKKIFDLNQHLDNINQTIKGKELYDTLVKMRPGLIDTLKLLENIYLKQQKETLWKRKNFH